MNAYQNARYDKPEVIIEMLWKALNDVRREAKKGAPDPDKIFAIADAALVVAVGLRK